MKQKRENCIENNCIKVQKDNLEKMKIAPFEDNYEKKSDMIKLFSFFLHFAPDIDSAHSRKISQDKHKEIWNEMMESRHFKYGDFCVANKRIEDALAPAHLDGEMLCLKCKRYVCKRKKTINGVQETDLDCFLRHIRNAIAHGRVYYLHKGNRVHILFEDMNNKKISARILCIKADLAHWKKVLMSY